LIHAVLGAGGVGGLVGGALARSGREVFLIVRNKHPRRLNIASEVLGDFEAAIEAIPVLDRPVDVLWVTVKATQLEGAVRLAPARFVKGTVVPLLNGWDHVSRLRDFYSSVTPGVIRVEAERPEPGQIRQIGPFMSVELAGRLAPEIVEELAAAGIRAAASDDEITMLWQKLVMLAPMALTTSLTGKPIGGVRDDPVMLEHLLGVVDEAAAVARTLGGKPDAEAARAQLLAAPPGMRTSMQKDREAGRPIELDAVAGPIQRAGRRSRVPTPHTDELVRLLR
jgi:2-dehydropantoate 2-reductase